MRRGALAWAAAMLAVLAGALVLALGAASASRAAEPVEFTVVFDDLSPGETRIESAVATLERDATLTSVAWVERTGLLAGGSLDVTVCRDDVCTGLAGFVETPMSAGELDVSVTVVADADVSPEDDGTALGRLTFVADDDGLSATGASLAALAWGSALLAAGVLLAGIAATRARGRAPERTS
ncbi:hypothetical protein GCM10009750_05020 [Agromyces salentinus]|uniref:Sortase n=1 Tax=Agromyces salentinus TaxID=269421 RepID=A0ABP4YPM0_9MICO